MRAPEASEILDISEASWQAPGILRYLLKCFEIGHFQKLSQSFSLFFPGLILEVYAEIFSKIFCEIIPLIFPRIRLGNILWIPPKIAPWILSELTPGILF